MATEHGQVSWEATDNFGGEKKTSNKDLFLKLEEGSNIVRIITPPYQYMVHKSVKAEGDVGFGRKVPCSLKHGSCPLCTMNSKPSPRYYLGVIDRKTGAYKVLDVSWSTFQDIKGFANDQIWGPVEKYDLNIIKDPKNPQKYYTIRPNPHTPLSITDQKMRDEADLQDLEYKSTPLTVEVVQKIVDKLLQGGVLHVPPPREGNDKSFSKSPAAKTASAPVPRAAVKAPLVVNLPPVVNLTENDNLDDVFPDYGSAAKTA